VRSTSCSFTWEKLKDLRENGIEFWAADGLTRLRILEADEKDRKLYLITNKGEKKKTSEISKVRGGA